MEKSARKYKVKFTVEETEDRRLTVKMNASPFLRTIHIMSIAGSIMENIAKSNNVPIETVLFDFCKGILDQHENVRLVEQQDVLKGD